MDDIDTELHRLPDRAVISVVGPEARAYLQRVITAEMDTLDTGQCRPGALLTPQGKILADFMIFAEHDSVWLDVHANAADGLMKRLCLFRLRARAEIAVHEDLIPVWSKSRFEGSAPDPRLDGKIHRAIRTAGIAVAQSPLDAQEIVLGVPAFGRDYGEAEVFPTDVNLDIYGGVGWKKGCFIGQEVVSRMKRRGTIRKRSLPAVFAAAAPPSGTPVMAGAVTIGEITSSHDNYAIVRARLDRLKTADRYAEADGQQANIVVPEDYWPEAAADTV